MRISECGLKEDEIKRRFHPSSNPKSAFRNPKSDDTTRGC